MDKEKKVEKKPEVKKAKTIKDYFSVGKWKNLKQYKCNLCAFDSLDENSIKAHIIEQHMPKPPKPKVEVKLLDRFGREVIKK